MSYRYVCKECGDQATKPVCAAHEPGKPAIATLGTWNCSTCKGKVKVRREKVNNG